MTSRASLVLALALAGCGAAEGVVAEPRALVFSPATEVLELRLVNRGEVPVPLTRLRIDPRDPDWGAFTIENRKNPRRIEPGDAVTLQIKVDRARFVDRVGAEPRAGGAHLLFQADGQEHAIALRFAPETVSTALLGALVRLGALAAIAGAAWAIARRRPAARVTPAWTSWLPALALLAVLPLYAGLCPDGLGSPLAQADLDQCAAGRGGTVFALTAIPEGWSIYLAALVVAGLGRLVPPAAEAGPPAPALRLCSRDLALAIAFAGPLLAFGTLDPRTLTAAQASPLFASLTWLPRWGVFVQPLAALVAFAVAAAPRAPRLERLSVAAAIAALFFGGWSLPGVSLATTPHAIAALVGCGVLAAKTAAIAWSLRRLHTGSRARAAILRLERVALPAALVSLLVTSAWALWR